MHSTTSPRPWGSEDVFAQNETVTVKLLHIHKGESLSLQYHNHRREFWKVILGNPELVIGDGTLYAIPGEEFTIDSLVRHRISAPEDEVTILEISRGEFDEKDIIRLDDKYGRA